MARIDPPTWVVVADHARARLFKYALHDGGLEEIEDVVCMAARVPQHELESDAGGRTPARGHADSYDPRASARAQERSVFARTITERLEVKRRCGELGGFYLIAEPRFLGELRSSLSDPLARRLRGEVPNRMTLEPADEIAAALPRLP
jgi:protein required for attachment to host cells